MSKTSILALLLGGAALALVLVERRERKRMLLGDIIPGGKAAGRQPSEFDPRQLRVGTLIEMEHTRSRAMAQEIAMDHLAEDPHYYTGLCRFHHEAPCRLL